MKSQPKPLSLFLIASLLAALGAFPPTRSAHAASILVNGAGHLVVPGNGICTLREAIHNANANSDSSGGDCAAGSGADTITFDGNYTITLPNAQLPMVTSTITVIGNGAANTIIEGGVAPFTPGGHRVLEVDSSGDLTLEDLTIRNGHCDIGAAGACQQGGAVLNNGALTIRRSVFSENAVTGDGLFNSSAGGGAIYNSGTLAITDSAFSGNVAGPDYADGGAIYNFNTGSASISGTTFTGNSSYYLNTGNGGAIFGGGDISISTSTFSGNAAYNGGGVVSTDQITITDSTFSDNSAAGNGGGIIASTNPFEFFHVSGSTFRNNLAGGNGGAAYMYTTSEETGTITNSTFADNSANFGGAIYIDSILYLENGPSSVSIINSTLSGNSASVDGGGIYNYAATTSLYNAIIANSLSGSDCSMSSGILAADSYNLDTDGSCDNATQKTAAELNLDAPADNGGPTQTIGLLPGSHAVDAGDAGVCAAAPVNNIDQRGAPRPEDGNGDGTATCDVGASELYSTTTTILSGIPTLLLVNTSFTVDVTVTSAFSTPSGIVNVGDGTDTCAIALSGGSGSCLFTPTTPGASTLTASYLGAPNLAASSDSEPFIVYSANASFQSLDGRDGTVLESSENSGAGGSLNNSSSTWRVGDGANDAQYRSILHFVTGPLPNNAVIVHVDLQIRNQGLTGNVSGLGGLLADIRLPGFGASAALELQDFPAPASLDGAATFSGGPGPSGWMSTALDPAAFAYINLTGPTQFRLRFSLDDNDDLSADYASFFSGNSAAGNRPVLMVYYYTVP